MPFSLKETVAIALIAFVGIWVIDKGLQMTPLKAYAIGG